MSLITKSRLFFCHSNKSFLRFSRPKSNKTTQTTYIKKPEPTIKEPNNTLNDSLFRSQSKSKTPLQKTHFAKSEPPTPKEPRQINLLNPLLFTVGFTGVSFATAIIWNYENSKSRSIRITHKYFFWEQEETRPSTIELLKQKISQVWGSMNEGNKVTSCIIAANALVFLSWRFRGLQKGLHKYFTSAPSTKTICWPMFLSSFSHTNALHFAANMYVLWSFGPLMVHLLGKEQFLALYCSAGVVSSFTSLLYKTIIKVKNPSIGASGALMAILGSMCVSQPNTHFSIIFLPIVVFTASTALTLVLTMDTLGILLGWRIFDHAAHLGGCLYGVWYVTHGNELIWGNKNVVISHYEKLRDTIKKSIGKASN